MARDAQFDLAKELAKPSFTPGRGDARALVELVVSHDDPTAARAATALARLGDPARVAIEARLDAAPEPATVAPEREGGGGRRGRARPAPPPDPAVAEAGRARLVAALGLLARAGDLAARTGVLAKLGDASVRVRRAAIHALGKLASQLEVQEPRPPRAGTVPGLGPPIASGTTRHRSATMPGAAVAEPAAAPAGTSELAAPASRARSETIRGAAVADRRRRAARATLPASRRSGTVPGIAPVASIAAPARLAPDLDEIRAALLARWDADDIPPDERRALAEALGKVGGDEALARLRALEPAQDGELSRRRDRALLMADRTARRGDESEIASDVAPPAPLAVQLRCRAGLGRLLVEELGALGLAPLPLGDHGAAITLAEPWSRLSGSRLWASAAIRVPLAGAREDDPAAIARSIVTTMTAPPTRALLQAWTRGPIRWRLGFAHGHKRSIVWRVARDVTAAAPELVNDPAATTWEVLVDDDAWTLELVPRRIADPRFAWRVAEVPAASHPSVAAALAFVAEARPTDRVWDPFCGSAVELVERARRGAYRSLLGSDLDPAALEAARTNLASAEVAAELVIADARTHAPGPVDLILSNPPLGSRMQVDAGALLVAALPNLVRALAPHGRLVWITPARRKTTPVLEQLGLRLACALPVDLGGVRGQLERWDR